MKRLIILWSLIIFVWAQEEEIKRFHPDDEIEITDEWAIELKEGTDPYQIAEKHGHIYIGSSEHSKNVYFFKKKPETLHGVTHPRHLESSEIVWAERQVKRQRTKRSYVITDPNYFDQWHLHSVGQDININVTQVWDMGNAGQNIVIAVVDDGLQHSHPDIQPNYLPEYSYDFYSNDPDPKPDLSYDTHGTSAGGVAGARDDGHVCGVGSAFRAGLAGIRLISGPTTDKMEGDALGYKLQNNHIFTNSWGPSDDGRRKEGPGRLATDALLRGATEGRGGKGVIYVWAGGNGRASQDNCNYDGWANLPHTIAIGAVGNNGKQSYYSEDCAMLVVSAPSSGGSKGVTTTQRSESLGTSTCRSNFGGTSAAAPLAAGVVALILQTNPSLTWRDVQGVLIDSATKVDPTDGDWVLNGARKWVNHKYGFGLINAYGAILAASSWKMLPPSQTIHADIDLNSLPIQDLQEITSEVQIASEITVEFVEVYISATHGRIGDLSIKIISPSGTVSVLAEGHRDTSTRYDWTFRSIRKWGESSNGVWKFVVKDVYSNNLTGLLNRWSLNIIGH